MKLSAILEEIPGIGVRPASDADITGIACDSRLCSPGFLFVAIRGEKSDGHAYIAQAERNGAAALMVEDEAVLTGTSLPAVVVKDTAEALGLAASAFHGHPSRSLTLIGITGTNGKTTTAFLLQHILKEAGVVAGRMGTVGYSFPSGEEESALTTPDAPAFQAALARMVREGATAVVAEISSHALHRKRVEGSSFACTVFTNLTQDHLDFHRTMEEYFEAKRLLFTDFPRMVEAVVNIDDPWGRALAPDLGGHVVTFGTGDADVRVEIKSLEAAVSEAVLHFPELSVQMRLPLAGRFNVMNAAAALAAAWALGLDPRAAVEALNRAPQTPGRLESVANGRGVAAFVDYAHTPDALERILETLKPVTREKLWVLFGCGGDRDKGKRPLMAAAAAAWADVAVITSDNSRSEPTASILDQIEAGFPEGWKKADGMTLPDQNTFVRIEDRRKAIEWAAGMLRPGDTLVLAGKGHETTQTMGGVITAFDDRKELARALAEGTVP